MDASLCHGSMGVSHMYRRAYLATGEPAYHQAAQRWLDHALDLRSAGPAGFACWRRDGYIDCFDLLQGIAGIGLGLLAAIDVATPPAWDRCLLLS